MVILEGVRIKNGATLFSQRTLLGASKVGLGGGVVKKESFFKFHKVTRWENLGGWDLRALNNC